MKIQHPEQESQKKHDESKTGIEKIHKPNMILDLDNTVISAIPSEEFPYKDKDVVRRLSSLRLYDMDGYYTVFERPGLQKFLDFVFDNFNVNVWTAATKDYAAFIIDKILLPQEKTKRKLDWVFVSYHGRRSYKRYKTPKQLKMLWEVYKLPGFNEENTFILDDHPGVKKSQPLIAILVPEFEVLDKESEKDSYLIKARKNLEDYLREFYSKNGKVKNPSAIIERGELPGVQETKKEDLVKKIEDVLEKSGGQVLEIH